MTNPIHEPDRAGSPALCESCQQRPAIGRVLLPGDEVVLCGACLDDARALGLLTGDAA